MIYLYFILLFFVYAKKFITFIAIWAILQNSFTLKIPLCLNKSNFDFGHFLTFFSNSSSMKSVALLALALWALSVAAVPSTRNRPWRMGNARPPGAAERTEMNLNEHPAHADDNFNDSVHDYAVS